MEKKNKGNRLASHRKALQALEEPRIDGAAVSRRHRRGPLPGAKVDAQRWGSRRRGGERWQLVVHRVGITLGVVVVVAAEGIAVRMARNVWRPESAHRRL